MATKVKYKPDGRIFLLLGVGFAASKAISPSALLGSMVPYVEEAEIEMVALCDQQGTVCWARSDSIEVVEIDGATPAELLGQ